MTHKDDGDADTFLTQGQEHGVVYPNDIDDELNGEMHVSESTRLHKKLREMKQMDDKLAAMKQDYAKRMRIVKQGEKSFLEKQKNTIEYLRKFKAFIVETDTKRTRAEKKEADERRQTEAKKKEIEQLKRQHEEKKAERDKKLNTYEQIKQYQAYLEKVLSSSDQYTEIDELLTRHKILEETNEDLKRNSAAAGGEVEEKNRETQLLLKNKQNEILVKNSDLARLLTRSEEVTNQASILENDAASVEQKSKEVNRKFGEVQMAIRNIHGRASSSYPTTKALKKKQQQHEQATQKTTSTKLPAHLKHITDPAELEEALREIRNEKLLVNLIELLDQVGEKVSDMIYVVDASSEPTHQGPGARQRRREDTEKPEATATKEKGKKNSPNSPTKHAAYSAHTPEL